MPQYKGDPQNKHHFRDNLIPERNEGLDVGLPGQRFDTGRFKALVADTLDVLTATIGAVVSITVSTLLTLSYLGAGYLKTNSSGAVGVQTTPIPVADGGTGVATIASGEFVKGAGTSAITTQSLASLNAALDHGTLGGLADDDHTQYTRKNTLTTTGDIYYASSANTPERRAIGNSGEVLTVSGGVPAWAAPSSGLNPIAVQVFGG